ncbi:hypothetical protein ACFVTX_18080 [Agromyces sp. NPDC058136]|uniref:hypothetical protein n=1 Tax=Agromyces sp. NPDC058136 TaxID=3346354 RepID=UPI0036DC3EEB
MNGTTELDEAIAAGARSLEKAGGLSPTDAAHLATAVVEQFNLTASQVEEAVALLVTPAEAPAVELSPTERARRRARGKRDRAARRANRRR